MDVVDGAIRVQRAGYRFRQLLMYAARCGVRSSLGLLVDRSDIVRAVATSTPDRLIRQFAKYRLAEPRCLFAKAHFFAFGSYGPTVNRANDVVASVFELTGDSGFSVSA